MTEQLPPDVIAQLIGMDPAVTPELVMTSWALLKPFHDKVGYTAPRIDRDLRYGAHERNRLDVHTAGHSAGCVHVASYLAGQGGGSLDGIRGAGLLSGFYQIPEAGVRGEPEASYYGRWPSAEVSTLPALLETEVPLIFAIAERDPRFIQSQIAALTAAWFARRGTVPQVIWSEGHNHISQIGSVGVDDLALGAQLARFVDRVTQ